MSDIKKNEWVKPFEQPTASIKIIGKIKFGMLETKDDHCYIHNNDYINEYHAYPSGKTEWKGCPLCYEKLHKEAVLQEQHQLDIERRKKAIEIEPEIRAQNYSKAKGF